MSRTLLFGQKASSAVVVSSSTWASAISMVIIRIWWGVVSIVYVIHLEIMHVGLEEIECTDVVDVHAALPRVLAKA